MKRFLRQFGLFLIITFTILETKKAILNSISSPFWGNPEMHAKVAYLKEVDEDFELLLFGSSLTKRQLVPSHFEERLGLKTFNLGIPGMRNPESWFVLEHLLEELPPSKRPKYMLLELQRIGDISQVNENSIRNLYFLDFERMRYGFKKFRSKAPEKSWIYLSNFLKNEFKVGTFLTQLKADRRNKTQYQQYKGWVQEYNGFYSLEMDTGEKAAERIQRLRENPQALTKRLKDVQKDYKKPKFESSELRVMEKMITLCEKYNVEPIILVPPRKPGTFSLFQQLKKVTKINMSNPVEYPQFYSIENSFDVGHLNYQASVEYSKIVCDKLQPLISKE